MVSTIIAVLLGLFISTSVSWPLKEIEKASKALAFEYLSYQVMTIIMGQIENS